jgi:DNA (cytosine-5)-methyltransferase 1
MLRLQGFPEDFIINIPYSQLRKVAGNSVSVPVIRAIANEMLTSLKEKKEPYMQGIQLTLLEPKHEYRRSESSN